MANLNLNKLAQICSRAHLGVSSMRSRLSPADETVDVDARMLSHGCLVDCNIKGEFLVNFVFPNFGWLRQFLSHVSTDSFGTEIDLLLHHV